jgi:hypothetical protein
MEVITTRSPYFDMGGWTFFKKTDTGGYFTGLGQDGVTYLPGTHSAPGLFDFPPGPIR